MPLPDIEFPGDVLPPPLPPLPLMVPLVVREILPSGWEVYSEVCEKVVYTTKPGEPEPHADADGTVHVETNGETQIFLPDIPEFTDCSWYDEVIPVSVIDNLDGTFEVYSNVCGFNIFES